MYTFFKVLNQVLKYCRGITAAVTAALPVQVSWSSDTEPLPMEPPPLSTPLPHFYFFL